MDDKPTPFQALQDAVTVAGGQSAMSRICGVTQPAVWKWLQSGKRLPAEYVLTVEAETGVCRHLLRPDIYPASLHADPAPDDVCGPILSPRPARAQCNNRRILDGNHSKGIAA